MSQSTPTALMLAPAEHAAAAGPRPRSVWIISPLADLVFLVGTPLAIVPLMIWAQTRFTVEQISLFVISFASIGHHLPGFLRSYADRGLFERFKWRLLLAPPLAIAAVGLSATYGLHGVTLILLGWATWHVLMQTYGFLRIYDIKRGLNQPARARLDFWTCVAVFTCGVVLSDSRMFGIVEVWWRVGLPLPSATAVEALRWTVGLATAAVLLANVAAAWSQGRSGQLVWIKLLLLATTGGLFWFCGAITTNVLIGVAMFEIFHAVQYYALVWAFDRKLGANVGRRLGPLARVFADRWYFFGIYLAAIVAYGSIRYFSDELASPVAEQALLAVLTASTLLHFYFDGFIWKVSERPRGATDKATIAPPIGVRPSVHAAKWGVLGGLTALLLAIELVNAPQRDNDLPLLASAATWSPRLADVQTRLSRAALAQNDVPAALAAAEAAAELRPESDTVQADLGVLLLRERRFAEAAERLQAAVRLNPDRWQHHFDLASMHLALMEFDAAEDQLQAADKLQPGEPQIEAALGRFYLDRGGVALKADELATAEKLFKRAVYYRPHHSQAWFDRATAVYAQGDLKTAERLYLRASKLSPPLPEAHQRLAAFRNSRRDYAGAADAYRDALKLLPDDAATNYNLGLMLLQQGEIEAARPHIDRANKLGQPSSPEVVRALRR